MKWLTGPVMNEPFTQDFLGSLPGRIEALKSLKLVLAQNDDEAEESIIRLAHLLKGSGAMFGFAQITETAKIVEDKSDENFVGSVDRLIATLQKVLRESNGHSLSVLVVEDDELIGGLIKKRLVESGLTIYLAPTGAEANRLLEVEEISLIILDLVLPDIDGRNFLVALRQRPAQAGIPVIVISAKEGSRIRSECYALGADGYFEKPFNFEELAAAVSSRLEKVSINARESRTDPLTGLANRAALTEGFSRATNMAIRNREEISIAILDVDHFKTINDSFGHRKGDEVLRGLASHLSEALRVSDLVGRWGGEEFVIIFPGVGRSRSKRVLEKALAGFGELSFRADDNQPFNVTYSGGVVNIVEGQSLDEAVASADKLLFRAKVTGRNKILIEEDKVAAPPKQIFLAEDDEIVANIIKHRLSKEGWEVIHFSDGESAFNAAAALTPSLALLDVKMPGMDGFELLENLQKITHYRKIPLVMLTSMGSEQDIVRGFEAGAIDYIMKPFSPIELIARLRRLMKA